MGVGSTLASVGSKLLVQGARLGARVGQTISTMTMRSAAAANMAARVTSSALRQASLKTIGSKVVQLTGRSIKAAVGPTLMLGNIGANAYMFYSQRAHDKREMAFYMDEAAAQLAYGAKDAQIKSLRNQIDSYDQRRRDQLYFQVFTDNTLEMLDNAEYADTLAEIRDMMTNEYFSQDPNDEYLLELWKMYRELAKDYNKRWE